MAQNELVITRELNAPRELVFKVWTKAEHLAKWWGPKGFALEVANLDFRPGGMFHYSMKSPTGDIMWGRFDYREIVAPEKIVFTNSFSDEAGNITRAPFSANWPLEILNKLALENAGTKTILTLSGYPINATDEECGMFEAMRANLQQGFGGTFEQLEAYLAEIGE
jgi:uncharacterized protein YndB with AHSA1/START domain